MIPGYQDAKVDMIQMQRTLKNNSEDIQSYVKDLNSWQKDVGNKKAKTTKVSQSRLIK